MGCIMVVPLSASTSLNAGCVHWRKASVVPPVLLDPLVGLSV
jgi:hypothetical protein